MTAANKKPPLPHESDIAFEYECAFEAHNIRRLKDLVKKWPLPNNSLRYAYMRHHYDMFPILLKAGADPNYTDGSWTIIGACIVQRNISTLKVLLKYGANPNLGFPGRRGSIGLPSITLAAQAGNVEVLRLLIKAGADLFAHPGIAPHALFEAVARGHKKVVKFLIERGVTFTSRKPFGKTALEYAEEKGMTEIHDLLLQYKWRKNNPGKSPKAMRAGLASQRKKEALTRPGWLS